jgi:hypothetical protein
VNHTSLSGRFLALKRLYLLAALSNSSLDHSEGIKAMDTTPSVQDRMTGDHSFLRKATRRVKVVLLAVALAVGVVSTASASTLTINTDASWLATNVAPAAGWNTNPLFNTAGWINAFVFNTQPEPCYMGASCIWYDGQFSATRYVWLRKTFTISDPVSVASLTGGVDDDVDIYVNGTLVYADHNGFAEGGLSNPLDLTAFLVQGVNLIAVAAEDNIPVYGQNHTFVAHLQIESPTAVPEPASLLLLAPGLAALLRRRRQSKAETAGRRPIA